MCRGLVICQIADIQRSRVGGRLGQRNIHIAGENIAFADRVARCPRTNGVPITWPYLCVACNIEPLVAAVVRCTQVKRAGVPHQIAWLHPLGVVHIVQHSQRVLAAQQRFDADGMAAYFGGQRFVQHHAVLLHQLVRLVRGTHGVEKSQHYGPCGHQTQRCGGGHHPPAAQSMQPWAARQYFLAQCSGFLRRQGIRQRRVVVHPAFQFGHRSALLQ